MLHNYRETKNLKLLTLKMTKHTPIMSPKKIIVSSANDLKDGYWYHRSKL